MVKWIQGTAAREDGGCGIFAAWSLRPWINRDGWKMLELECLKIVPLRPFSKGGDQILDWHFPSKALFECEAPHQMSKRKSSYIFFSEFYFLILLSILHKIHMAPEFIQSCLWKLLKQRVSGWRMCAHYALPVVWARDLEMRGFLLSFVYRYFFLSFFFCFPLPWVHLCLEEAWWCESSYRLREHQAQLYLSPSATAGGYSWDLFELNKETVC